VHQAQAAGSRPEQHPRLVLLHDSRRQGHPQQEQRDDDDNDDFMVILAAASPLSGLTEP
jgi:hypothetical protein